MAQNSSRDKWTAAVVDDRLKEIMYTCYDVCFETGKEYSTEKGGRPSLVAGANIAGFLWVAFPKSNSSGTLLTGFIFYFPARSPTLLSLTVTLGRLQQRAVPKCQYSLGSTGNGSNEALMAVALHLNDY